MSEPGPRQSLMLPILIPVGALAVIGLVLFGFSRLLLSTSPEAATIVALVVATTIFATAAVVASRERLRGSAIFSMLGVVAGVAMIAGGVAVIIGPASPEGEAAAPVLVKLAAPKGASSTGFDQKQLTFPAGDPIDLAFDNQDPGVEHNVAIFSEDPAKNPQASALFAGPKITGLANTTYHVKPLQEGTYFFHCEVHPTTMTGTIQVSAGGTGLVVRAKELAFDTDKINLPPDQKTTITFENQDAGTQHNIGIYSDKGYTDELFKGEIITGPDRVPYTIPPFKAGTYFFRCDVHTTMTGTVIVGTGGGGGPTGSPRPTPAASASGSPSGRGGSAQASIDAVPTQRFSTSTLNFPSGVTVAFKLDNQDPGQLHNFDLYSDAGHTTSIAKTEFILGPGTASVDIPSLDPGTYYFRCDAHPDTMFGTVTVS